MIVQEERSVSSGTMKVPSSTERNRWFRTSLSPSKMKGTSISPQTCLQVIWIRWGHHPGVLESKSSPSPILHSFGKQATANSTERKTAEPCGKNHRVLCHGELMKPLNNISRRRNLHPTSGLGGSSRLSFLSGIVFFCSLFLDVLSYYFDGCSSGTQDHIAPAPVEL